MLTGAPCSAMEVSLNGVVMKKPTRRVKREPRRKATRQTRAGGARFAWMAADLAKIGKGFHARPGFGDERKPQHRDFPRAAALGHCFNGLGQWQAYARAVTGDGRRG